MMYCEIIRMYGSRDGLCIKFFYMVYYKIIIFGNYKFMVLMDIFFLGIGFFNEL